MGLFFRLFGQRRVPEKVYKADYIRIHTPFEAYCGYVELETDKGTVRIDGVLNVSTEYTGRRASLASLDYTFTVNEAWVALRFARPVTIEVVRIGEEPCPYALNLKF